MSRYPFILVLLAALVTGQPTGVAVAGELVTDHAHPAMPGNLMVEFRPLNNREPAVRTVVSWDGSFRAASVAAGNYNAVVLGPHGEELQSQLVNISPASSRLTLRLNLPKQDRPGGLISAARLAHRVPKSASKMYAKSISAGQRGRSEEQFLLLRRAVELDPDFMEARNDLATKYYERGDFASALENYRKAAEMDPSSAPTATNLAAALVANRRAAEAEVTVRHALRIDPSNLRAKLVLALALLARGQRTAEVRGLLTAAAAELPSAGRILSQTFAGH